MNKLKNEKSPYLLQHANNPVEWFPWEEESFEKARKEDKPIFLSIGYSTCHWCHVMAHESFEDREVADLMNEIFVSIKVDREERPDIDKVYMNVCQMMTGSGGWPLTIIMTPNKKPFFAGTYFPKNSRFGRIGLLDLIKRIKALWSDQKEKIIESANQITFSIQNINQESHGDKINKSVLKKTFNQLSTRFDEKNGGFGENPKFPMPHNLIFLLRFWKRTGDKNALEIVEKTLKAMRKGGIFDHVGYGFHRYSTDSTWLVPHFEKMLYDQALVAMAYIEAFQATKNKEYRETAQEIFTYVLRDMTSPEGGFYSAEDADSEGQEGKFYVWSTKELEEIFVNEELDLVSKVFNIKEFGNYLEEATGKRKGYNILHLKNSISSISDELNIQENELIDRIKKIRQKLYKTREKRVFPHKDDKILTDWNGLMIAALAKGAIVFQQPKYLNAAKIAVNFILLKLRQPDGRLLHRYRGGISEIKGFLTDYAFLIWGLIELYEATFDIFYLKTALELHLIQMKYFWDAHIGGFYFTAEDSEELLIRQKEVYDGAIPSGNSVAMLNLFRLNFITGDHQLEEKADILSRVFTEDVKKSPMNYTLLMVAIDFFIGPTYSLVIAGNTMSSDTLNIIKAVNKYYIPNKVFIHRPTEQNPPDIDAFSNFVEFFENLEGKTTAYVCINKTCKPPTHDINKIRELLNPKWFKK